MSSKLIRGVKPAVQSIAWPIAGSVTQPSVLFPQIDGQNPAAALDPKQERIQELEVRIRSLERETEQRSQAAHQQGVREGDAAARRQLAAQTDAATTRLAKTIEELSSLRSRFRHEAEEQIIQLSLAIARRILHRELTVDPEALLGLARAALDRLDAREVSSVRVHPDAAPALREQLERIGLPQKLDVIADPSLQPGAAVFETTHGTLDASTQTQLAEIERGLTDLVRRA